VICSEAFPYDEDITVKNVEVFLQELVKNGLILRFKSDRQEWLWSIGWEHQYIQKPTAKYPAPPVDHPEYGNKARQCIERFYKLGGKDYYIPSLIQREPESKKRAVADSDEKLVEQAVEDLASAIEMLPGAQHRGSTARRKSIHERIENESVEWVSEALQWIMQDGSDKAVEIRKNIARYPSGVAVVEKNGKTIDRLDQAHRLKGKNGFHPAV